MSLKQKLELELERAAAEGLSPRAIEVSDGKVQLTCDVTHVEHLACAFTSFELQNAAWASQPIAKVKRLAEQLAQRLTYLLEPIRPIEVDAEACVVQLRSNPPLVGDDATTYYELEARGGGKLRLSRFHKAAGEPRERVQIEVTRAVLGRLADDFAAVS